MSLVAAFKAFIRVLKEGEAPQAPAAPPPPVDAFKQSASPAVQVLGLLQKEGRLVDFLMEDVAHFSDAEIGAAVREIHAGSRKVLTQRFKLVRVMEGVEGSAVTVPVGYNAGEISMVGSVSGGGPWKGTLNHRGWRVAEISLPTVPPGSDAMVVAQAEVQV